MLQLSDYADGILLLSLISGRNPDYLISKHVDSAMFLKQSRLEVISTGYILIGNGNKTSSVEYISNTKPIPPEKPEIAVSTAVAGEMIGHKLIYLEAGSGSDKCISRNLISAVKSNINIPLIVGGGIDSLEDAEQIFDAGANIIVIGTAIERDLMKIETLSRAKING